MPDPIITAATVASVINSTAKEAYMDLLHPSLSKVGDAAGKTTGLVTQTWEAVLDSLGNAVKDKLKGYSANSLTHPDPRLTITAANALFHSANNEDLRDMFANLLANNMVKDSEVKTHPAFVTCINEMSNEDAKFIKYLADHPKGAVKVIDLVAISKSGANRLVNPNVAIVKDDRLQDKEVVRGLALSIDNLSRLGLIKKGRPKKSADDEYVTGPLSAKFIERQSKAVDERGEEIGWYERLIRLNNFGLEFALACVYPPGFHIDSCEGCAQKMIKKD